MPDASLAFLGWDRSPLPTAVAWVLDELGADLSGWTLALPGARAVRRLREGLAREAEERGLVLSPPRLCTTGQLSDDLLRLAGEPARGVARGLAWERALRAVGPGVVGRLTRSVPEPDDARGWRALAEQVRRLHGELAAEALDARRVLQAEAVEARPAERVRWEALHAVQEAYARVLAELDRVDPHGARLAALDAGALADPGRSVLLVGVVEANRLLRKTLDAHQRAGGELRALVFAPEDERAGFDALGCVVPEAWAARRFALDPERWIVVDGPVDQAAALVRVLAEGDEREADRITVGVPDAQAVPFVRAALEAQGVAGRAAEGRAVARSSPGLLLAGTQAFLEGRGWGELCALWRHAELERALLGDRADARPPAALLDRYHPEALPRVADGQWRAAEDDDRARALAAALRETWERFEALLGDLLDGAPRPVGAWSPAIAATLRAVLGDDELDPDDPTTHERVAALRAIGDGLAELEALPATLQDPVPAAEALALLLEALRSQVTRPPAADPGTPTLELLGWLELALDDAPTLVVTGMVEGAVPETPAVDPFLPEGLRRELGLAHDATRLARDAYTVELLRRSRDTHWITPRRAAEGDPLRPSRLCLRAGPDELPEAVLHWIGDGAAPVDPAPPAPAPAPLPVVPDPREVETYSVTSFGVYLNAPHLFHLKRQLGLDTLEDGQRELDPPRFGNLAHQVLEVLRDPHLCQQRDAGVVRERLEAELERRAAERFGPDPLPAVRLQVERLRYRLGLFAGLQAERAGQGWRVLAVEWGPTENELGLRAVPFEVDGRTAWLTGRIDRVDRHEGTGAYALWDYKTGGGSPNAAHRRRDGTWVGLQLPLYVLLARELLGDAGAPPVLGFAKLGKDEASIAFQELKVEDDFLEEALEEARRIVRAVREGAALGAPDVREERYLQPVERALLGLGLAGEDADGSEEDEA